MNVSDASFMVVIDGQAYGPFENIMVDGQPCGLADLNAEFLKQTAEPGAVPLEAFENFRNRMRTPDDEARAAARGALDEIDRTWDLIETRPGHFELPKRFVSSVAPPPSLASSPTRAERRAAQPRQRRKVRRG